MADVRFRIAERLEDEVIDVTVDERSLRDLRPEDRPAGMFLVLDHVLGEEDVERFVDEIECGRCAGAPRSRRRCARRSSASPPCERSGRPRGSCGTAFLQGEQDGKPFVVTAYTSIRRIDHPLQSTHARIEVTLVDPTELGFTTQAEADVQNALQDELETAVGDAGLVVARETGDGRRIVHFYIDPQSDAPRAMREWCAGNTTRVSTVAIEHEPDWASVKQFGLR